MEVLASNKFFESPPTTFPNGHGIRKFFEYFLQVGKIGCYIKLWLRFGNIEFPVGRIDGIRYFLLPASCTRRFLQ